MTISFETPGQWFGQERCVDGATVARQAKNPASKLASSDTNQTQISPAGSSIGYVLKTKYD